MSFRIIGLTSILCAVLVGAFFATPRPARSVLTISIQIVGADDTKSMDAFAVQGYVVVTGIACPPGVSGGIYGDPAPTSRGQVEHPVGCVVMEHPQ
jgi:hypothetical protein